MRAVSGVAFVAVLLLLLPGCLDSGRGASREPGSPPDGETYRLVVLSGYFSGYGDPTGECIGGESTVRVDPVAKEVWTTWLDEPKPDLVVILHPKAHVDGKECSLTDVIVARTGDHAQVPLPFMDASFWTVRTEGTSIRVEDLLVAEGSADYYRPDAGTGEQRPWAFVRVHNEGAWGNAGLHRVGRPWTSCCPPDAADGTPYFVLEFHARLEHDPPMTFSAVCGRPGGTFGGIDLQHQRLELVDAAGNHSSFAQPWRVAVLEDIQVKGRGCQNAFLHAEADDTFTIAGYDVVVSADEVAVAGTIIEPGSRVFLPYDAPDSDGRASGTVEVRLHGPWASGRIRWVSDELQVDHSVGFVA